jgi:predicted transcriptional regulator
MAGDLTRQVHLLDAARRDIPTCRLTDCVGEVWKRVQAEGWDDCVVVNQERIVLGRMRGDAWQASPDTKIEEVMDCGLRTYRPHVLIQKIKQVMRDKELDSVLVTTSDGELLGVFYQSESDERSFTQAR